MSYEEYDVSDGTEAVIDVLDVLITMMLQNKQREEIRRSERDLQVIRTRINLLLNILETTKCTA